MQYRCFIAAATTVAALALASSSSAGIVQINSDQLATSSYVVNLGGTVDGTSFAPLSVYESPDVLNVSIDNAPPTDLLVFCVDVFHEFDSSSPPATYETALLQNNSDATTSGDGVALGNVVSGEIGYLADLGQATTDSARLAGIQGAIWEVEYSGLTVSGGSSYVSDYVGLANAWGASHADFSGDATAIYAVNGQTQGFVTGGVPEPETWALLLVGFGALGASLRTARADHGSRPISRRLGSAATL